jgi:hypothetical protein
MTHANEGVEVEARRQHLHTVVAVVRDEHEVVGCYPHLAWTLELQRLVASTAYDPQSRAVRNAELVDGGRVAFAVQIRHEQRGAVAAHSDAVAE